MYDVGRVKVYWARKSRDIIAPTHSPKPTPPQVHDVGRAKVEFVRKSHEVIAQPTPTNPTKTSYKVVPPQLQVGRKSH